jgi:uncharacterized membrane protein
MSAVMEVRTAAKGSPSSGPQGSRRARLIGRRAVHPAGVTALTALIAAIYATYSLTLFNTFRSTAWDLVIFDQAVRSYAHFHPGISIIKGVHNGFGPQFSALGDHFSPILAALAPLYWAWNGPQTLLVAQAVLFAVAIPPLWVFTRRALGGGRKATAAAYLIGAAYGLSWPLAAAAAFDFHEVAFAPVLTAIALERFQAGRLRPALAAMAFLLLVKEDMGLLVAGIGCYLTVSLPPVVRRQRIVGVSLVIAGVAYTALATYLLIPAFGGRSDYYWAYGSLGRDVPQATWHLIRHPLSSLRMLVTPGVKLTTIAWLLIILGFLPLLSPIVLAVIPLLAERMLNSKFPNWWLLHFQYNAYLVVPLTCAAVDGAARLDRWAASAGRYLARRRTPPGAAPAAAPAGQAAGEAAARPAGVTPGRAAPRAALLGTGTVALACAVVICGLTLASVPRFQLGDALHARFYEQTARTRAAAAADAVVPSGVQVEAVNTLGSQLSGRDTVLLWDGEHPPAGSPWVVADVREKQFTFGSVRAQRRRVALLRRTGYRAVFERDGYIVLHRAARRAAPPGQPGTG